MTPSSSPPRRLKRSRELAMTSLMAASAVSLAACDNTPDTPRIAEGKQVDAFAYSSLQACQDANEVPDAECAKGWEAAQADSEKAAPRYEEKASCEDVYGEGQCVPRSAQGGNGSFWGPLITGFVVGRMLDGGYRGTGLYRDWRDGGYYTGYGGRLSQDYATGRTRISEQGLQAPAKFVPPKVQTRTSVLSRGGFGGRMSARSYSGGGGHWGG